MSRTDLFLHWLIAATAVAGLALMGCQLPAEDDDDDNDDAADDDAADDDDDDDDDDSVEEDCWDVFLYGDGEATFEYNGVDDDERWSFTMQGGVTHVIVTLTWDARGPWEFGLDVGEGTCPDHGTTWGSNEGGGGELITDVHATDLSGEPDEFPEGANAFVHVRPLDTAEHEYGESVELKVAVQMCKPA